MRAMSSMTAETVGPSTLKLFRLWAVATVSFVGCAAGLFVTTGLVVVLVAGIVVACLSTVMFVVAAVGRRPRVEIRTDGFVFFPVLGSRARRWSDIHGDFVVFRLT